MIHLFSSRGPAVFFLFCVTLLFVDRTRSGASILERPQSPPAHSAKKKLALDEAADIKALDSSTCHHPKFQIRVIRSLFLCVFLGAIARILYFSSMYPNPPSPKGLEDNTALRHLPTYEEVNIPYSLRLPTYRSSYIRRFHPYARYTTTPSTQDFDSDSSDYYDEDTLLDLTILDEYAPRQPEMPLTSANEIHVISSHDQAVEVEDLSETEASLTDPDVLVESEGPRGAFLRIDAITPMHSTES